MNPLTFLWALVHSKMSPPKDTKPDMTGLCVLVTGSNTGLGLEAATKFVQLGAKKVILAVRNVGKGEDAARKIVETTQRKGVVEVWQLDMQDYPSIQAFAKRAEQLDRLDIAILNAGVSKLAFIPSKYGWEETLQVNVISTAYLGMLLIPKLKASSTPQHKAVLEIIGSGMHLMVSGLKSETSILATANEKANFNPAGQYAMSKLFVMYIEQQLVKLMESSDGHPGAHITVVCPGATKSDLARDVDGVLFKAAVGLFSFLLQKSTEEGSRSYISGVELGEKGHGRFWHADKLEQTSPLIQGEKGRVLSDRLWEDVLAALEKDVPGVRALAASKA